MAHLFLRPESTAGQQDAGLDTRQGRTRSLTCYTDAFIIRGTLQGMHRRLTDALNVTDEPFLVLEDVTFEEFRTGAVLERAAFAQVNLSTVLFAYQSGDELPTTPELRSVKVRQPALVSLPPFRVVGQVHLPPERSLRDALRELLGRFVPLTEATFWSDPLGIPRTSVAMLAFNHARSQILAPSSPPEGEPPTD
jgi:hypothetical protein